MSRIEEVLRRASREGIAGSATSASVTEARAATPGIRDDGALAPAWEFADDEGDRQGPELVAPSGPAPVALPAAPWDFSEEAPAEEAAPEEPVSVQVMAAQTVTEAAPLMAGSDVLITRTLRLDAIEQYRKLAASLHEAQMDRGIHSVLCTSALMGEGKTVTACNLALTLSESYGRRVLLIDADLRRPQVHVMFGIPNESGLREVLTAPEDTKLRLRQVTPRLSLLTAGSAPGDPMSGLTSDRLRQVIAEASMRFDWVIVDTPPVLILPDARVLVSTVDAVLLVVRAGSTTYRTVKRAVDVIKRERIFGAVLNSVEEGVLASDYAGYDRYYAAVRPA